MDLEGRGRDEEEGGRKLLSLILGREVNAFPFFPLLWFFLRNRSSAGSFKKLRLTL